MNVFILHDTRMSERWQPLVNEILSQGIKNTEVFDPVECSDSVIKSINLSHKAMIRAAKERELPEVCILEDDVCFAAPGAWERFLEDTPPSPFDIYLGGAYGLNRPIANLTDKINGFHCYICRERFYDTFLSVPDDVHIDTAMDGKGVFYIAYPFLALQRASRSANTRAFSDKNADLFPEDIFKG